MRRPAPVSDSADRDLSSEREILAGCNGAMRALRAGMSDNIPPRAAGRQKKPGGAIAAPAGHAHRNGFQACDDLRGLEKRTAEKVKSGHDDLP
jgi:hypothetical protein